MSEMISKAETTMAHIGPEASFEERQLAALRTLRVPEAHIKIAQERQLQTHEPLAVIMSSQEYGFITPEIMAQAHGLVHGIPYFDPRQAQEINAGEVLKICAEKGIEVKSQNGLIPVRFEGDEVVLLLCDPESKRRANLEFRGLGHRFMVGSARTFQSVYQRHFANSGRFAIELYKELQESMDSAPGSRTLRRFLLSVMRHGCYLGASDLAFTPMDSISGGVIRYKVNGSGTVFLFLERLVWSRIINSLLGMAGGSDMIKKGPIEAKWEFKPEDSAEFGDIESRYAFRMEFLQRRANNENEVSVIMRLLDKQSEVTTLEALDFSPSVLSYLRKVKEKSTGLFLVTGPTGSGKTTTLYSLLSEIDPVSRWVQSIENPIEYSKGLWVQNQIKTGGDEAVAANQLLKGLLRAAPDVILFGEVRKGDVANELIDASNTGHLVFGTMHTNTAALAISRLRNFGVDMGMLSSLLLGILSQRLVRTLCPFCKGVDDATESLEFLDSHGISNQGAKLYRPVGCPECGFTGFRGRKMVSELLRVDANVRELIESGANSYKISEAGIEQGASLNDNAMRMAVDGLTSVSEIQRIVVDDIK